ncbi:MAG: universal stress protein [Nitrospira sp.]
MKILLTVDGSDHSYEAVRSLKYLTRAEELHVVHVLDVPSPAYPMMMPEVAQELYETVTLLRHKPKISDGHVHHLFGLCQKGRTVHPGQARNGENQP